MEVFGNVPRFLAAFGHGPPPYDKVGSANNETWAYAAKQLRELKPSAREKLALEFPNPNDRTGPLVQTKFQVKLVDASLSDGGAFFDVPAGVGACSIVVPFADIASVYRAHHGWVVRVVGALNFLGDRAEYIAFGRDEPRGATARGTLRLKELGPLKDAAMTAWRRLGIEGFPAFYAHPASPIAVEKKPEFEWRVFAHARNMLSIDDQTLTERCDEFVEKVKRGDDCWFAARAQLDERSKMDLPAIRWQLAEGHWGDRKGQQIIDDAHAAYVMLLRHIDGLVA
jgi:hypothetical protein